MARLDSQQHVGICGVWTLSLASSVAVLVCFDVTYILGGLRTSPSPLTFLRCDPQSVKKATERLTYLGIILLSMYNGCKISVWLTKPLLSLRVFSVRKHSPYLNWTLWWSTVIHVYYCIHIYIHIFLVNKTNRRNYFQFYWYYDSTCFGQAFCPSSGVLSRTTAKNSCAW